MGSYKARRRQSKYTQILKKDLGIDFKEEPSKHLMIGNAGLVSGVTYEQLTELFTQYGLVERVVTIPGKSYSFVVYSTVDDAVNAYNAINGRVKLENMDGPIYLLYTPTVPTKYSSPESQKLPDGLTLLEDFVSPDEEEELLNCVSWNDESQDTERTLKHRRVKHYGYEFCYDINNVDKDSPLAEPVPRECDVVMSRLRELGHPLPWIPDQLTVNQYQKGQGIPSHVDTHSAFESPLLSLSLGSDVVMEFRRDSCHVPVLLPRRSLLIMDGEARYAWSHGITPRTMDVVVVAGGLSVRERGVRTSFTLRKVRPGSCQCRFSAHCDSQLAPSQPALSDQQAVQVEQFYVHNVYNSIAGHFSETRTKVWPNVLEFLTSFSRGSVVIDAGCGNGKYFGVNPCIYQVGFDRSLRLAEITKSRGHEVFVCDCLRLPLRDGVSDGVISIAVLHHLATRERRLQALEEMRRVLTRGGRALVSVWAKDQTKRDLTSYLKQDRKNRRKAGEERCVKQCETENTKFDDSRLVQVDESEKSDNKTENTVRGEQLSKSVQNTLQISDFKLPVHTARTQFQHQDLFVPWKVRSKASSNNPEEVFLRYYHVFEENELFQLCNTMKDVNILQTYYTEGNWCIVFEKV